MMRVKELFAFIKERHAIYQRRAAGQPKPWTKDSILQSYRFCNVYRELDTVTAWIRVNWREPYDSDPNLWFAMVVARLINLPAALEDLTFVMFKYPAGTPPKAITPKPQVTWVPDQFISMLHKRRVAGLQVFNSAYIVSTNGRAMDKVEYLEEHVLTPLWAARVAAPHSLNKLRGVPETLYELHGWLSSHQGLGSFMAAQVVADVKFQTCWQQAPDWWTFAAPGPGSKRGLNRVYGYRVDDQWGTASSTWGRGLKELRLEINPLVAKAGMPRISAQDLQNCLCEFDKYERVRLGEGRPKSLYPGGVGYVHY